MKPITWEYKTLPIQNARTLKVFNDKINEYGQKGWELVGIYKTSNLTTEVIIFKRPCGYLRNDLK